MRCRLVMLVLVVAACRDRSQDTAEAGSDHDAAAEDAALARADPRPEAGALVDPRCEGMSLSLFETACDVPDAEWVATAAPPSGTLAQEARVEGKDVVFAIVNRGTAPVSLPLRFDERQPGKSLSVIAEVDAGIYELASPRVALDVTDAGTGAHLHSARIKLLAGGRASARLKIDLAIVERLDKRGHGADSGTAAPLGGPFTLHIGQLFSHVEVGDPARVTFTNDLAKR